MKYIKTFNEMIEPDNVKSKLESLFPNVHHLEYIGSGMLGHAYLGTIGYDMVVVKLTNSVSEYYMTKLAMISNPPHTVKFYDVKPYDESKFLYGIVHEYVNRDAMPDESTWHLAMEANKGKVNDVKISKKIRTKEQKYEFELAKKKISELEEHFFGIDIDTQWQNWGYDENRNLVIFDLDGNMSRPKYELFLKKYSNRNPS